MIQNKVVADLLQHRADVVRMCAVGNTRGIKAFPTQEQVLHAISAVVAAPTIHIPAGYTASEELMRLAFTSAGEQLALPYENVGFVAPFQSGTGHAVTLLRKVAGAVSVYAFAKFDGRPWAATPQVVVSAHGVDSITGRCKYGVHTTAYEDKEFIPTELVNMLTEVAREAVLLLAIVNSMRVAHIRFPIAASGRVSLQTLSANKSLCEYHEVKLSDVPGYISQPKGGTHASPRWHMRRGHWRQYKTGKRVWIENMEVGDKKRGVVQHDYVVTANHLEV